MNRSAKTQSRGLRDFSQEQRDRLRRTKRNDIIGIIIIGAVMLALAVTLWAGNHSASACTGSQSVIVHAGDGLESMISHNVRGINHVDIRDVVYDVAEANGLSNYDIGHLQPGTKINHIPASCGG